MTLAKLAVLGSGAVARAVGPRLREAGYGVACWARRDPERVGVPISLEEVQHFDAAWLLVSDRALAEVSAQLVGEGAPPVVLHASGFFGTEVLADGPARGVLHPLVSFPREGDVTLQGAGASVCGGERARGVAQVLAEALGLETFEVADEAGARARYHAAAALGANGVAALFDLALEALPAGIDEDVARRALGRLMQGVLENARSQGARGALTGPVVRGDEGVVDGHLASLDADAAGVYRLLVERMRGMVGPG